MPFIDKSPLAYQINTTTSIRRWEDTRAPTAADYKQFKVGDLWLDTSSDDWYILCYRDQTTAIWRKLAGTAAAIEYLLPDGGTSPVVGDATNQVTFAGGTGITTVGGLNTVTWNIDGDIAQQYTADVGTAVPAANNLNVIGGIGVNVTGAGSTLTINAGGVDQQNIIYVGKHGNDANDGLTIEKAKLTFANAITAAFAIAPAAVVCLDHGTYTENLTLLAGVTIYAPDAILTGSIDLVDDSCINFFRINVATGATGILKSAGAGMACVEVGEIVCAGTGDACVPNSGTLYLNFDYIEVIDGNGIGDFTSAATNLYFYGDEIVCTNAAANGIAVGPTTLTTGYVGTITGAGRGINATGNCRVNANQINTTLGIRVNNGDLEVFCNELIGTTAVLLAGTGILNLHACRITGTITAPAGTTYNYVSSEDGLNVKEAKIGTTHEISNTNLDNTSGTSHAMHEAIVGGASGGDPYFHFEVSAVNEYSLGIDNSDSDNFKLTDGASPSAGNVLFQMTTAGVPSFPTNPLGVPSGGTGVNTITDHALIVGSGVAAITEIGPLTNGQLVIGSTGADPVAAVPTNGANITWTVGAGTLQADLTGTTDHAIQLGNATGSLTSLGVLTNGQLAIGSTGADPVGAALTAPAAGITITGGAGSITFALANDLAAVEGLGTTGVASRTAADTWATSSITQNALLYGSATQGLTNLGPLTNGQLAIGSTGNPPSAATLTAGAGITITNGAGSITITNTGAAPTWQAVSAGGALSVDNGYICIAPGGALSFSLPATSAVGDEVELVLDGATSWTITQGAGQSIRFGLFTTTVGAGGSLASTAQGDAVRIVCSVANTKWNVLSAVGNLTVT